MKRIISAFLALVTVVLCLALVSCQKEPGKTVEIGNESVTFPSGVDQVTYSLPDTIECNYTAEDGTVYNLYMSNAATLESLSEHTHEKTYPDLTDKQDIADISAAIFADLYPEKEIVYDGASLSIKACVASKSFICCGKGNDGGYAALSIEKATGKILMIVYSEPAEVNG